jgi:hypothetical protein
MDLYQSLVFAGSVQVPKPGPTREAQWTATDMVKGSVNSADKMEEWQEASSTQGKEIDAAPRWRAEPVNLYPSHLHLWKVILSTAA